MESKTVDLIKYVLSILVVCLHCIGPDADFLAFCVPVFFLISGYYFFYQSKKTVIDISYFLNKWRKRIHSLLIPFILWILLYYGYMYCFEHLKLTSIMEGKVWISIFWNANPDGGIPLLGPFWYIRDLIKCCILSPLLYVLLKNRIIGLIYVFVVFTAYFINFQTILPVSNMVLFFFSIGCYFGLHAISQVDIKKSYLLCSFLFFTLTLLLAYVFSSEYHDLFKRIYIISSFLFIYSASYLLNKAIKLPEFLFDSNCSFFIYAIHMFFYTFVFYITTDCMKLAHGSRTLATPSVIILSIATYYLLLRIAPKFLSVLLGGRLIRKAQ